MHAEVHKYECGEGETLAIKTTLAHLRALDLVRSYVSAAWHDGKIHVVLDPSHMLDRRNFGFERLVAENAINLVISRHRPIFLPPPR